MSENRSLSDATPNDTFNALRRRPIHEMEPIYRARFWEFYTDTDAYTAWLEEHGWNDRDFIAAGKQYEQMLSRMQRG